MKNSTTRAIRPPEFISGRLLKVRLELRGRAKVITYIVSYAPNETQNTSNTHTLWTALDRAAVEEVPEHGQLVVLTNANVRMQRREKVKAGRKNYDILGA